ncbi:hypothetical protein GXW82_13335 [Streptacidiphilus sp. 4-A2]|nr:hypothetical protein [Streptacidiphilus sp. 4-A2]
MGTSVALWRPDPSMAAVRSLSEALDVLLRIPGAVGAVIGELSNDALLVGQAPNMPEDFALAAGRASLDVARQSRRDGETPEEIMITGMTYCSLQQVKILAGDGCAVAQVTLVRKEANPALARMHLRRLLEEVPRLLPKPELPRRHRRPVPGPVEQAEEVEASFLQRILELLRTL